MHRQACLYSIFRLCEKQFVCHFIIGCLPCSFPKFFTCSSSMIIRLSLHPHPSVKHGDLSVLLGGISEIVYDNTISVGQSKGVTDQDLALELKNYMGNYQKPS